MLIGMFILYCLLKETASRQKIQLLFSFVLSACAMPIYEDKNHFPHTSKYLTHDNLHLLACFVLVCHPTKGPITIPKKHLLSDYANEIFNPHKVIQSILYYDL